MDCVVSLDLFDAMNQLLSSLNLAWLFLMIVSGISYGIAEWQPNQSLGPILVGFLFLLAAIKGWCVIDVFMGLRWAPRFWRIIMLAWLIVVCVLLSLIFAIMS